MKCPYCGSTDVQATNMGKRVWANIAGFGTAFVLTPFMRQGAKTPAMQVRKNICPSKEYICLNDLCRRKFSVSNY